MELDKALRLALITLLEDKVTVASWGISNIIIKPSILIFDVDGMKYKGTVSVEASSTSGYTIKIGEESYSNWTLDSLVSILDKRIECTANYLEDLREWILHKGV